MKSLIELYDGHQGFVSDKWEIYLRAYEKLFKECRHDPVSLLEIGVQNGGSLEILATYFQNAKVIVGCDIDIKCANLSYNDPRIKIVIGDINLKNTEHDILNQAPAFDIIIDDGSHTSTDIIKTFLKYFIYLKSGGLFVIEDLHCSYWEVFGGGLHDPHTPVAFFKKLIDVINHEHWGVKAKRKELIDDFLKLYRSDIAEADLAQINSIEFLNSLCIIRKDDEQHNLLGRRIIAGTSEMVKEGHHDLIMKTSLPYQECNPWSGVCYVRGFNQFEILQKLDAIESLSSSSSNSIFECSRNIVDLSKVLGRIQDQLEQQRKHSNKQESLLLELQVKSEVSEQKIQEQDDEIRRLNHDLLKASQDKQDQNKTIEMLEMKLAQSRHRLNMIEEQMNRMGLGKKRVKTDNFDSVYYMSAYPDLVHHSVDPVVHYLFYGQFENRRACPPKSFLSLVPTGIAERGGFVKTTQKAIKKFRVSGMSGVRQAIKKVQALDPAYNLHGNYSDWINKYDALNDEMRNVIRKSIDTFHYRPKFSVLMPVYNAKPEHLIKAIESVKKQLYNNWELCIADDKSTNDNVLSILRKYSATDKRIITIYREENGHISAATNSALECATGDFIVLLDQDDVLSEHALFFIAKALNEKPGADIIYSDEDKIDEEDVRYEPYFKPNFDPLLFMAQNMISHLGAYRTTLVRDIGGFREGYEGSQDWDLALRVYEKSSREKIHHIPRILYHWRATKGSTALSITEKDYAANSSKLAVNDHLQRTGQKAVVVPAPEAPHLNRVVYERTHIDALISIIIPTRDKSDILRMCVDSIINKSSYSNYEILIVDNGSIEDKTFRYLETLPENICRVIRDDSPFNFSRLNNTAVSEACGQILCFANNDIEIQSPDWMEEMASFVLQPHVGCVGARLWYPTGELQHGGVLLGIGGVASHAHYKAFKGHQGYFGRAVLHQEFSAVTAAALMIRRNVFHEVKGFDENLAVAFNDVDLCLRVKQAGYSNIWTPYAEMIHHESVSRGSENSPEKIIRFQHENEFMRRRWGDLLMEDPAYNPNLCLSALEFELAWPPRIPPIV